ncbi:ABC transporter permease [Salinibacterium sp. dk2585]|uniref:ABC transporter permease n=1 Tax=unclassified Salinibacterium TaxID=2632331 RepID=UPI0011C250C8|nr:MULTISPECIES: ABC transporter permease [unclassified Salinibacterium]QEE61734.1 ABC transporter permease [Salinibacterium sp. dk2585]TXK54711.1 ABC transporter permease [Salinibacterium sp. dk5596]
MSLLKRFAYFVGLPVVLLILWWALTIGNTNFFVPKPLQLFEIFGDVWFGERMTRDVLPSIGRILVGIVVSIIAGVVLGILIGSVRVLRMLMEPALEFLRAIPPPVIIPVFALVMGINDQMRIAVIVFGCIWPVLLNTIEGVRAVDSVLNDTCAVYGIRGGARLRHLVLRAASPQIMTGVRQSISIGLILMVISEMLGSASSGLGHTIVQFQRTFAVPEMWTGIILLGLLGVALSLIFQFTEKRVLRWYHGLREVDR